MKVTVCMCLKPCGNYYRLLEQRKPTEFSKFPDFAQLKARNG